MASIFSITSADIQGKILPNTSSIQFTIGDTGQLSDAGCLAIIEKMEDKLKSMLDQRYRKLLTKIDGEILTGYASAGETSFTTSFQPITNLKVYLNYPERTLKSWLMRNSSDAMTVTTDYTVNLTTGVITLVSGLSEGDKLWVEYNHTGAARLLWLKDLVESMTAIEISRRFALRRNDANVDRYLEWEEQVNNDLMKLRRYRDEIGIPAFDDLSLVYDDTDDDFYKPLLRL